MPNWCRNRVEISGEPEEVKLFMKDMNSEESPFDYNQILPMPEPLRNTRTGGCTIDGVYCTEWIEAKDENGEIEKILITEEMKQQWLNEYGASNWYDWACNNWGVKWNNAEVDVDYEDGNDYAGYYFDSPWGPPEGVCYALREKYPNLSITWFFDEPGMQSAGYL